jgi:peptidoglycan glycosyltransferase
MALDHGRRRRVRRVALIGMMVVLLAVVAGGVFFALDRGVGLASKDPDPVAPARTFLKAWSAGDLRAMYREVAPQARATTPYTGFSAAYRRAAATATLRTVRPTGQMLQRDGVIDVPVVAQTRIFGPIRTTLEIPVVEEDGRYWVSWKPLLTFPGLEDGERLARQARPPAKRGAILARDRTVLARGPADAREYPRGTPFAIITGHCGPAQTGAQAGARRAQGWPQGSSYGLSGLEASLDPTLAGTPTIRLLAVAQPAGTRVVATRKGRAPHNVVTTLSVSVQDAVTTVLDGMQGGIVVMDARTGAVRASAGLGMDLLQPPGSTFKIVTAAAALTAGKVSLGTYYEPAHFVQLGGFRLRNFHGELCGGTLLEAFAHSCNSVFAPVAIDVGAEKLADMAAGFGFGRRPSVAYPAPVSVMPRPAVLNSDLEVGVAGIGQGGVTATALQMASAAQVIAAHGLMHPPWLARLPHAATDRAKPRRVISRGVANEIGQMMQAVVSYGTGVGAAGGAASIAGKTGTAEVGPGKSDAWFVGYSPATAPEYAVGVLVVRGGVGGTVAAPMARDALSAALAGL